MSKVLYKSSIINIVEKINDKESMAMFEDAHPDYRKDYLNAIYVYNSTKREYTKSFYEYMDNKQLHSFNTIGKALGTSGDSAYSIYRNAIKKLRNNKKFKELLKEYLAI